MAEKSQGYAEVGVQRIEGKQLWVWSVINGAYQIIRRDDDPTIYPLIQLSQGWRNGNIHLGNAPPPIPPPLADRAATDPHTYDLWIEVTDLGTGPEGWKKASSIYVLDEGYS